MESCDKDKWNFETSVDKLESWSSAKRVFCAVAMTFETIFTCGTFTAASLVTAKSVVNFE